MGIKPNAAFSFAIGFVIGYVIARLSLKRREAVQATSGVNEPRT